MIGADGVELRSDRVGFKVVKVVVVRLTLIGSHGARGGEKNDEVFHIYSAKGLISRRGQFVLQCSLTEMCGRGN